MHPAGPLPLHHEDRFERGMETMRIISEAVTLADVTVKRAYFWRAGSKTERAGGEGWKPAMGQDREIQKERVGVKAGLRPQISIRF